jgi:hypothetical protein
MTDKEPMDAEKQNIPPCLWELGGDCPRHEVMRKWRKENPE